MTKTLAIALLSLPLVADVASGQVKSATFTPLQVTLTLTPPRESGGAAATYALYVLADSGGRTELRTGREVAVPVTTFVGEPPARPVTSFQYRNVGMNVTCRAFASQERYRLQLQLERSTLLETRDDHPSFQTFNTNAELLLRDGELAQLVLGSDPSVAPGWNVSVKLEAVK